MWSRAELKTSAKQILQKNYWAAVLVALIVSFSSGATINLTSNFYNGTSTSQTLTTKDYESQMSGEISGGSESAVDYINQFADDFTNIFSENEIKILAMIFLIIALISIAIRIFIFAPLQVGSYKWMLNNRITNPSLGQVADGFRYGYLNIVKVMFLKDLFQFFWSLLFIIPGIIKGYEYRMIPFLLAENPHMSYKEAFDRSKRLMNGNKADAFVLDLSFFGWYILATLTCGLLGILFINPYVCLTDTELYVALCMGPNRGNTQEQNYQNNTFNQNTYDV